MKKWRPLISIVYLALHLSLSWPLCAQPLCAETGWRGHREGVSAEISLSGLNLTLDDLLNVEVRVRAPEGFKVDREALREKLPLRRGEESEGLFSIVREEYSISSDGEELITFILEPWGSGSCYLGFLPLAIEGNGTSVALFTELFELTIEAPVGEIEELAIAPLLPYDDGPRIEISHQNRELFEESTKHWRNRPFLDLFESWKRLLSWGTFGACAAFFVGGTLAYRNRSRLLSLFTRRSVPLDPRQAAQAALLKLEEEGLPRKGLFDRFYVTLTGIVRLYIEEVYYLRAPERTTQEFLSEMALHPAFDDETKKRLQEFLVIADLVKFARLNPSLNDCAEAMLAARELFRISC